MTIIVLPHIIWFYDVILKISVGFLKVQNISIFHSSRVIAKSKDRLLLKTESKMALIFVENLQIFYHYRVYWSVKPFFFSNTFDLWNRLYSNGPILLELVHHLLTINVRLVLVWLKIWKIKKYGVLQSFRFSCPFAQNYAHWKIGCGRSFDIVWDHLQTT